MDKRDCRLYHITISWISRRDNGAHILVFAPFAICIVLHTYKIYYKCTSAKCGCKILRFATLCLFRQLFIYWLVMSGLIWKIMDFCANRVFYQQNRKIIIFRMYWTSYDKRRNHYFKCWCLRQIQFLSDIIIFVNVGTLHAFLCLFFCYFIFSKCK